MNNITIPDLTDVLTELEEAYFDIPFENSKFQDEVFVISAQKTPGRAYRAIGLKMFAKIQAINELKFNRKLEDVDIEEWEDTISKSTNPFECKRLRLKIEKAKSTRNYTNKLLNDAIEELNYLYGMYKKLPKYTREMFEKEEELHFNLKLQASLEAKGNGAVESLLQMERKGQVMSKMLKSLDQSY